MKIGKGLVEHAYKILEQKIPYFYGAKMEVITQEKYNVFKKMYPNMIPDSDKNKVGKLCCDCSGLISSYTGIIQNSATMKSTAKECHPISIIAQAPLGAILWHTGHVGIYVGNNEYIAEESSAIGIRKQAVSKARFTHWLIMSYINYNDEPKKSKAKDVPTVVDIPKKVIETLANIEYNGNKLLITSILVDDYNYVDLNILKQLVDKSVDSVDKFTHNGKDYYKLRDYFADKKITYDDKTKLITIKD